MSGKTLERNLLRCHFSLYNITEDFSQLHVKLYFRITKVEGDKAYTVFKGHDLARDYLRSLVRRGSSRIDGIFPIVTKDGYRMRVGVIALSTVRTKSSQKHNIRQIMEEVIAKKNDQLLYDELIQQLVLGKIASEIKEIYEQPRVFFETFLLRSSMSGCQPFSSTVLYVTGFPPKNLVYEIYGGYVGPGRRISSPGLTRAVNTKVNPPATPTVAMTSSKIIRFFLRWSGIRN
jgi:hypothetical protein